MKKMILITLVVLTSSCATLDQMGRTRYWIVDLDGRKMDGPYSNPVACYNTSLAAYKAGYAVRIGCISETINR